MQGIVRVFGLIYASSVGNQHAWRAQASGAMRAHARRARSTARRAGDPKRRVCFYLTYICPPIKPGRDVDSQIRCHYSAASL